MVDAQRQQTPPEAAGDARKNVAVHVLLCCAAQPSCLSDSVEYDR